MIPLILQKQTINCVVTYKIFNNNNNNKISLFQRANSAATGANYSVSINRKKNIYIKINKYIYIYIKFQCIVHKKSSICIVSQLYNYYYYHHSIHSLEFLSVTKPIMVSTYSR
jgi:hypothetical protein